MIGLLTRLAVIPTLTIIIVAIATTKIPMLAEGGFWKLAHEGRTDFSMLLGLLFLLIVGAGRPGDHWANLADLLSAFTQFSKAFRWIDRIESLSPASARW